ncbi:MAG: hypothetical protein SOZ47_08070 [Lawsonibacter sp.]|nr:hypothetical protein [Lawsonibacter sp.]
MMDAATFQVLEEAKDQAECEQAMFGGIKAVLGATEDAVRRYLRESPFESGIKTYLDYHGEKLQDLLSVIEHLLMDMEERHDSLVDLLAEKTFEARQEWQEHAGEVSAAL